MKQLKKSLSLLLALMLLVSSMAFTANAAAYPDVEGSKYEKAINLVSALGIMTGYEDGSFAPDQPLTRAEYCMVLCRMLGLEESLDSVTYVFFEDVLEEHWAAKAISVIFSLGYANGYGNGNFGPEHSVLYQDAVKMTVNALGYGFMTGDVYPDGYMTVASENGLLKGISEEGAQPITRGALAQLVYNSLNLELLEEVYTTDGVGYEKGGETLLTRTFKAIEGEGKVTANATANILGNNPVKAGQVRIDGVLYNVGTTDADDYLGYNVHFYYTVNDDGDNVLLMCEVKSAANDSVILDVEDITEHTSQVASGSVTYITNYETSKTMTLELSANPSVIYNGKKVSAVTSTGASNPDYSLNILIPDNGTLTFIDNDGDGAYDVLEIKAISTYIVNGIDKNKNYIYLKSDSEKGQYETLIDLSKASDRDYYFSITKGGEEVEFTSLAEWDILSVMKSLDEKSYTIYVSTEMVNGYISEVATEEGVAASVVIEGEEYDVVSDYYSDEIKPGLTGTFYLDYAGKIAGYNSGTSGAVRYVYLMAVDNQSTRLTTDASIKVCTTAGSFAEYKLAEEVRFTGYLNGIWETEKRVKAGELCENVLTTEGKVNDQLIVIDTNDQNEVSEIEMACDINTSGDDYDEKLFSQDLNKNRFGTAEPVFNLPRSRDNVGNEGLLPNSSPIFSVAHVEGASSIEENRISIVYRRDESIFDDTVNFDLFAYDMSAGGHIPVAVIYADQKPPAIDSYRVESGIKLMMVNDVVEGLDENGDPVTKIIGLSNGQATEVIPSAKLTGATPTAFLYYDDYLVERATADGNADADAAELLAYLMPGDMFWYNTDMDGLMTIYQPLIGRLEYATNEDGSTDASQLAIYKPDGNNVTMPLLIESRPSAESSGYDANTNENSSLVAKTKDGWLGYGMSCAIYGTAYDKDPATNSFRYKAIYENEEYILSNYAEGFIVVYDVETETFKSGSLADMVTYKQAGDYANKVIVHMEYAAPSWIVIYQ